MEAGFGGDIARPPYLIPVQGVVYKRPTHPCGVQRQGVGQPEVARVEGGPAHESAPVEGEAEDQLERGEICGEVKWEKEKA